MATNITLSGWKEFEDKARNMPKILMAEVDEEVKEASRHWAQLAAQSAPVDQGFLVGKIKSVPIKPGEAETVSTAEYSAYLEWGTRTKVRVPGELSGYASQFRGGKIGKGDVKFFIYEWCRRKGIPKEAWWPIFISIMVKGINPHPFFFIQRPIVEKQLITNVQNILNTEH